MQRTLVILKPDAVQRRLCGEILRRFEQKGLKIVGMKFTAMPRSLAEDLYRIHAGKSFYNGLLHFVTAGPVVLLALEGLQAIEVVRRLMGATSGHEANPGTIRGDLGLSTQFNLLHGSDSAESADRELRLFFEPEELVSYSLIDDPWTGDGS